MKISYKIPLVATTIITVAFAIFSSYQYMTIRESLYKQAESDIEETAGLLSVTVSQWLNTRLDIMQGISEVVARDFSTLRLRKMFSVPRFNEVASYYYGALDSDGVGLTDLDGRFKLLDGWDGRTRPWYAVAKRHDIATMTEPYPDSVDQRLLITAVAQIYNGTESVGAMGADIELKAVSDVINSVNFHDTGYAFLVKEDGKIITHPAKGYYDKNISELFNGLVPNISTNLQHSRIGDDKVLTAFFPLTNFSGSEKKWFIGVVVDEGKVLAPAYQQGKNAVITAIITAILSSLIFYFFMRSVLINPVRELVEQSDEISRGRLTGEIDSANRNDEVGELAQAIQRLQKSLRMAIDRLKLDR